MKKKKIKTLDGEQASGEKSLRLSGASRARRGNRSSDRNVSY